MGGQLEAFWGSCIAAADPALHGHPMLSVPNWKARALPLLIYGDGAAFTRTDSLEIVSCSALGQRGSTWRTRLVLASFVKSAQIRGPGGTWDRIWEATHKTKTKQIDRRCKRSNNFKNVAPYIGVDLVAALSVRRCASCNGPLRESLACGIMGPGACWPTAFWRLWCVRRGAWSLR
jgi:hypothetical protein